MTTAKLAAATAAVALLAGCTTVTTGDATKDPSFRPGDAIVSLLNPGNYPTAPKPGPALKQEAETGRIIDGERMGEYVVGPWEVDPQLVDIDVTATGLMLSVGSVLLGLDDVAKKHQFIYGFGSTRGTPSNADHRRAVQNSVLRFPNPEAAAAAASDFYAQDRAARDPSAKLNIPVPGHPEARAFQFTMPDGAFATIALTAHGPFVLIQGTTAQESADISMQLAQKALDLQIPRIDDFKPTDPSQFATMQTDPEGLLRLTVPTKEHIGNQGLWGPRGILHFDDDPLQMATELRAAGVDVVSVRGTYVYRTKDAAAATQLAQKFAEPDAKNPTEPGPTVPGLPSAKCRATDVAEVKARVYSCAAALERWVYTASSLQPFDATQRMASQYLLLTAK
ncbi:hypothetical protein [Mycolicibacterium sp. NCC-Tsukiji]|uniref:DUF7373 family lipoprotein n=1 Tax=Mycolicibacterium sp. NCC-Tsukiji TaxID=2185272 RepID=UPI000EEA6595|nr:hypothetical protein [Mycolicibacterium sp. NCC-Tsukiji]GCB00236.1 hypothetical protein NCCNTM_38700 [Mycolicibacterium sp. NCC-Tsukiji]